MKRTFSALLILFVSALLFSSCKKDKDESASVVGRWGLSYAEATINNGTPQSENYTSSHDDYYTLELKSDGKFIEKYNDGDEDNGSYRIEGNKIYFTYEGETEDDPNEFTVSQSEFTRSGSFTSPGNNVKWKEKFKRL